VIQESIRLDQEERAKLAALFTTYLSEYPDAVVRLYGSRIYPDQGGGDLDLLVISQEAARHAYELSKKMRIAVKEELGDQRIDIVVSPGPQARDQPAFVQLALLESVQIWP
jgi:hypothetical protein